ncbi:gumE protein [Terrihabitans soli]|uniref:GumE protein n=1 Tax=Terrihabitans soli TaxID=708113 RepID=A0A6S6QN43_9HYPH|nr:hypothetical protein [Terrihabitans soli]BCJ91924.1 gumE protein [Terrihabitans soli]
MSNAFPTDPYYSYPGAYAGQAEPLFEKLALALIIAAATFNLALALVNNHVVGITPAFPMAAEALIIGATTVLIARKHDTFAFFFVVATIGYFAILYLLRGYVDPKPIRDVLIPLLFFRLGVLYGGEQAVLRVTKLLLAITFVVGIWEWLAPSQFGQFFGVLKYFIAKGATGDEVGEFIQNGLNINALRPAGQGREIFSFLGPHRVSSIFLEPVTAGNFGAFCIAVFLGTLRGWKSWLWFGMAAAVLIFADARFGVLLAIGAIALYQLRFLHNPIFFALLPVFFIVGLAAYGSFGGETPNTLVGRLIYSGKALYSFNAGDWFGVPESRKVWHDSGFAYALSQFGILYCLAAWAFISVVNPKTELGRFRLCYVMCFICLSFSVSASLWSIKMAALMWFVCGSALRDVPPDPGVASIQPQR